MLFQLSDDHYVFPNPALAEEDGLLALGGDLSPGRMLSAYRSGVFPWFEEEGVPFWFSPDPRAVLFPDELVVQKSMRPYFNQPKYEFRIDTAFDEVVDRCAGVERHGQAGTWISPMFQEAYFRLFKEGLAHSAEAWCNGKLVGGLFGTVVGKVFCGESMFADQPNASKFAFISYVRHLKSQGIALIDCQVYNPHLGTFGARDISREMFLQLIGRLM